MRSRRASPVKRSNPDSAPETNETQTGSLIPGEPVYLVVGRLRRPHGLQGEMLMDVLTDFPERLVAGKRLFIGDERLPMRVAGVRWLRDKLLITFEGFDLPEQVMEYRNWLVYVPVEELPELPEGNYYHHQLIGLDVVNEAGQEIGVLKRILETGANEVLVVTSPTGEETLLADIPEVVLEIDLPRRRMVVRMPEWW